MPPLPSILQQPLPSSSPEQLFAEQNAGATCDSPYTTGMTIMGWATGSAVGDFVLLVGGTPRQRGSTIAQMTSSGWRCIITTGPSFLYSPSVTLFTIDKAANLTLTQAPQVAPPGPPPLPQHVGQKLPHQVFAETYAGQQVVYIASTIGVVVGTVVGWVDEPHPYYDVIVDTNTPGHHPLSQWIAPVSTVVLTAPNPHPVTADVFACYPVSLLMVAPTPSGPPQPTPPPAPTYRYPEEEFATVNAGLDVCWKSYPSVRGKVVGWVEFSGTMGPQVLVDVGTAPCLSVNGTLHFTTNSAGNVTSASLATIALMGPPQPNSGIAGPSTITRIKQQSIDTGTPGIDLSRYPKKCKSCGAPAYESLFAVECSSPDCGFYKA